MKGFWSWKFPGPQGGVRGLPGPGGFTLAGRSGRGKVAAMVHEPFFVKGRI